MKTLRKFVIPILLGMFLLILTACGGDDGDTTTEATQPPAAATVYSFQFACINRTLNPCKLVMKLADTLRARTNGQLDIQISSFPELGLAGPDTLRLLQDGTLDFGEIYGGYVGGDFPAIEMAELLGLYESSAMQEEVFNAVREDEIRMIREQFGAEVISYIYYPDQFIFSKTPLRTLEDFDGLKIRTHSTALGDLAAGLGASGQFVAFSEVYTALERGVLDAGVTGSTPAYSQKWYEVSKYIIGPLTSHPHVMVAMNRARWDELPTNLQQILKEEAAKTQAENLRLVNGWDQEGVDLAVAEGMEHIPFTPEIKKAIKEAVLDRIVPNWATRAGGYDSEAVKIYNAKVAPIVGVKINPDGSASTLPGR